MFWDLFELYKTNPSKHLLFGMDFQLVPVGGFGARLEHNCIEDAGEAEGSFFLKSADLKEATNDFLTVMVKRTNQPRRKNKKAENPRIAFLLGFLSPLLLHIAYKGHKKSILSLELILAKTKTGAL